MRALLIALGICLVATLPARAVEPAAFAGDWAGALDVGGQKLRLVVHLVNTSGAWSGSMDSLDQGANGIPFSLVTVDGARLHLEIAAIGGSYDGTLSDDGKTIQGTWKQSGASLTLDLARGEAASMPEPKRPQEPKPPFPYRAEDVTIPGPGGITLAGTLTLPQGTGPFPAVVLISGSGAQDRDELVFNHRPFLVLADHLTRQGLAVLRMDDRGTGKSTGHFATATTEDFAQDVTAEVAFIRARKDIDGKRVGLVGHSEGGIIAPMVASRSGDVSFIVLMAGVGVPMEHIIVRQLSQILKASGAGDEVIAFNAKAMGRMCTIAKADQDSILVRARLELAADSLSAEFAAMDSSQAAVGRQMLNRGIDMVSSRWFRYLLRLDFTAALKKVRVPVLAINGSLDIQVDPRENLPAIEKALRAGGNPDVTIREMPGLNHLFQTATTGSPMEYASIEETMSPEAMKVVSDWIAARTSARNKQR